MQGRQEVETSEVVLGCNPFPGRSSGSGHSVRRG